MAIRQTPEQTKAQKPLAAAEVTVEDVEGNPGYYSAVLPAAALSARGIDGFTAAGLQATVGEGGLVTSFGMEAARSWVR